METNDIDLVQLIKQLKDYVILDREAYEKLVQNAKPNKDSKDLVDVLKSENAMLKDEIEWRKQMEEWWKRSYQDANKRIDELQKELDKHNKKWWRL